MAANKKLLLFILLFVFSFLLFAQEQARDTNRIHRFAWSSEHALRYEVTFERMEDESYLPYLSEFTTSQFIELSLPVGKYRFQITPYDVLDRPSQPSDWRYVEVIPAPVHVAEIDNNVSAASDPLQRQETEQRPEPQQRQEQRPEQSHVYDSSSGAVPINVSAAWSPFVPIYGEDFGDKPSMLGFTLRADTVFSIPFNVSIGPELAVSFHSGAKSVVTMGANLLVLKELPLPPCAVALRLGVAYPLVPGDLRRLMSNVGASFRWRFDNKILLESGFDFSNIFIDLHSGAFRPWIGIGYQF